VRGEVLREALLRVREDAGYLTPDLLVEKATPPDHELHSEFTWDDGVDAIEAIQVAVASHEPWPNWTTNVSTAEDEGTAEAGGTDVVSVSATAGTIGVVCSANESPTGDVLTVFLVGPLEVEAP
jgi:hypothetical protein